MNFTVTQWISLVIIIIFALIAFIIKIYYFYTLRSKEDYIKEKNKTLWIKNVSILSSAVAVSLLILYPWYMYECITILNNIQDNIAFRIQLICMILLGQTGIIMNLVLFVKFVILKKYATFNIEAIYKEREDKYNSMRKK